jgi:hypothetical protein
MAAKARVVDFTSTDSGLTVKFVAENDHMEAEIILTVEGPPLSPMERASAFRELLHRVGVLAQEAAASPDALSWHDHFFEA